MRGLVHVDSDREDGAAGFCSLDVEAGWADEAVFSADFA